MPYQYFVINVINDDNVTIAKLKSLKKLEESVNKKSAFLKDNDWFLPRLVIRGEVLVPIDKELLEVLSDLKDTNSTKKEPLLLSMPPTDYSNRSFKLADLDSCIIVRVNLWSANLQGAELLIANLQGANLTSANLQGVSTNNSKFINKLNKEANLSGIDKTRLTTKIADKILKDIKPFIKSDISSTKEEKLKKIKARLQKAIGKGPIEWVKSQNPNLGVLTKEMADKIAKEVTNKKARERMGLDGN